MSRLQLERVEIFNHHVLPDHVIDLNGCRHLIITGPNGAGKTSVVGAIAEELRRVLRGERSRQELRTVLATLEGRLEHAKDQDRSIWELEVDRARAPLALYGVALWPQAPGLLSPESAFFAYLPATRRGVFTQPSGPKDLPKIEARMAAKSLFTAEFLQMLVNRHTTLHMERSDNPERAAVLQAELDRLTGALRELFGEKKLSFVFDKSRFQITLEIAGRRVGWSTLAAGHQAILEMVAEIYVRSSAVSADGLEAPGIVVIDEPELHLHPELQERILPGLTALFPNAQFIIATHSAPVICTIPDAWVHDLRDQMGCKSDSLVGRPYGSLLESHFKLPTDYDRRTTKQVEEALAKAEAATTADEKQLAVDLLEGFLHTGDPRVFDRWTRLSVELSA